MKYILGTKVKMTQVFDEEGNVHPVTVLKVAPIVVTQVKTKAKDGYEAIQVGSGSMKEKNATKPHIGHTKAAIEKVGEGQGIFRHLKEIRFDDTKLRGTVKKEWSVGDKIESSVFTAGDEVTVTATSKGKGFQGVVKRHGFAGGPRSHGQKHSEREAGSIGTAGFQRVFKNKRMAGRMGGDIISVLNVKVIKVDADNGEMLIEGAIPGRTGALVEVKG